jgi:hypothetical protein
MQSGGVDVDADVDPVDEHRIIGHPHQRISISIGIGASASASASASSASSSESASHHRMSYGHTIANIAAPS